MTVQDTTEPPSGPGSGSGSDREDARPDPQVAPFDAAPELVGRDGDATEALSPGGDDAPSTDTSA